ncbi:MAG: hypothetical protein JW929_13160 [Anaerolineales bacterium]|nr:hypothetical protein [Anaerolineales bacterium]
MNDVKSLGPELGAAIQKNKANPVLLGQPRPFHLSAEKDYLLTQDGIFHRQVGFASGYIRKGVQGQCDGGWFHPSLDLMVKPISKSNPERTGGRDYSVSGYGEFVIKTDDNSGRAEYHNFGYY